MLSKYGKDASVTAMVNKLDWVIMPVFNVDGYEYTHTGVSHSLIIFTSHKPVGAEGGGGRAPIYGLYSYVPRDRVKFFWLAKPAFHDCLL